MEQAQQLVARYVTSDSWLLTADIRPTEVLLECDFRVVSGDAERKYERARLRLRSPTALRIECGFPRIAPAKDTDDLGDIHELTVDGPSDAASVCLVFTYGRIETSQCVLTVELPGEQ